MINRPVENQIIKREEEKEKSPNAWRPVGTLSRVNKPVKKGIRIRGRSIYV